jgi:hypothetical protein
MLVLPPRARTVDVCAFSSGAKGCECDASNQEGGEGGEVGFWDCGHFLLIGWCIE